MYWHMMVGDNNYNVDRGIALHKMIRLVTLATINGGYLNFMGNELGHTDRIDIPRECRGWAQPHDDQTSARQRRDVVVVFNFNPTKSFTDYGFLAPVGEYEHVLDSDDPEYGGYGNIDGSINHFTQHDPLYAPHGLGWLKLYIPARSVQVLRLRKNRKKK